MKKFNFFFKLSFINYFFVLIAIPYITARIWADIILILFILSCIYQIMYIIFLRRHENITFLKSLLEWFLNITYVMDVIVIFFVITEIILNLGYIGGLEGAILIIIGLPIYVVSIIYKIIYHKLHNRNKDKKIIDKD